MSWRYEIRERLSKMLDSAGLDGSERERPKRPVQLKNRGDLELKLSF